MIRFIFAILLLMPFHAFAQANDNYFDNFGDGVFDDRKGQEIIIAPSEDREYFGNVRGFIWGLPKEIIRAEEKAIFAEESADGNILYYVETINKIPSSINYEFKNNKLYRVRIFSEKAYPLPQTRIDDYIKMKADIDARYGEPLAENFTWHNDREKDFPQMWGWAVKSGDLELETTWQDDETLVSLFTGGKADRVADPFLVVTFEDRKAKLRAEKKRKEKTDFIIP